MRFIQMHQTVANHDAIGNDIEIINGILGTNHESLVYAENKFNKRVEYVSDELIDEYLQDENTVVIYHHSVFWKNGFEKINFHKVQICVRPSNLPSKRVIEKCGFTYEGTLRDYFYRHGEYEGRMFYSILRNEYNG